MFKECRVRDSEKKSKAASATTAHKSRGRFKLTASFSLMEPRGTVRPFVFVFIHCISLLGSKTAAVASSSGASSWLKLKNRLRNGFNFARPQLRRRRTYVA